MGVNTANAYGRISVTDDVIAQIAGLATLECYGVVDLVSKRLSDSLADLMKKKRVSRGVKIITSGDRILIDLYVILKYGVSIEAVSQSLRTSVKYRVEHFTGMVVDAVNVNVVGVKV